MSCSEKNRRISLAGIANGVTSAVGKTAFFTGVGVGLLAGTVFLSRKLQRRLLWQQATAGDEATPAAQPPAPVEEEESPQHTTAAPPPVPPALKVRPGPRVRLESASIQFGLAQSLPGYSVVHKDGKDTGLALSPGYTVGEGGQVSPDPQRWYVVYKKAKKEVGGPYDSLDNAKGMASLFAKIDWSRDPDQFTLSEIKWASQLASEYRNELDFKRLISYTMS